MLQMQLCTGQRLPVCCITVSRSPSRPTFRHDEIPLLPRAVKIAYRYLAWLGFGARGFDSSRSMAAARRKTGLDDFGDPSFHEPLRRLCSSLERSSELSAFGRATLRGYCTRALCRRLEIEHCIRKHPEIEREQIKRPLFIVGLPRTGSTHLHHLLAADPAARAPLYWQLLWPIPPPDVRQRHRDPRILRARRAIRWGLRTIPELDVLHTHEAEGPEECHFLLDAALMNPLVSAGDDYEGWWRSESLVPAYRYHERQLKLLQWRWPADHWVLKAPFHLWHLADLVEVYPDARFIFTHRDPLQVVPSAASYGAVRARTYYERFEPKALGTQVLDSLAQMVDVGIAARARIGEDRIVDVTYREIVSQPLAVAERVQNQLGYTSSPEAGARMRRYLADHPQHKHGVHRYGIEQFGLSNAEIRERFASYLAFCDARFGVADVLGTGRAD